MANSVRAFSFAIILTACTLLAAEAASQEQPEVKLSADEQRLLELTNAARKEKKLPPFTLSPQLTEAARKHSANMAKQRKLDHKLDGKLPDERVKEAGYKYLTVGENISFTVRKTKLAEDAYSKWMSSAFHRGNILSAKLTEIGIGIVTNARGETYFTQVFAIPEPK
jgi:uncharacterized protein YkwD